MSKDDKDPLSETSCDFESLDELLDENNEMK